MQRNTIEMTQIIKLMRGYCNLWLHYVSEGGEDAYTDKIIGNLNVLQNDLMQAYETQGDTPESVEDMTEWMANKRTEW